MLAFDARTEMDPRGPILRFSNAFVAGIQSHFCWHFWCRGVCARCTLADSSYIFWSVFFLVSIWYHITDCLLPPVSVVPCISDASIVQITDYLWCHQSGARIAMVHWGHWDTRLSPDCGRLGGVQWGHSASLVGHYLPFF